MRRKGSSKASTAAAPKAIWVIRKRDGEVVEILEDSFDEDLYERSEDDDDEPDDDEGNEPQRVARRPAKTRQQKTKPKAKPKQRARRDDDDDDDDGDEGDDENSVEQLVRTTVATLREIPEEEADELRQQGAAAAITELKRQGLLAPKRRLQATGENVEGEEDGYDVGDKKIRNVVPAWASDWRYRNLPQWERDLRSPDTDQLTAMFMRGVTAKNHMLLREVYDQDKMLRAKYARATIEGGQQAPPVVTGDAQGGGNLLPFPLAAQILELARRMSRMPRIARMYTTPNKTLGIPVETTGVTPSLTAEAGTIGDASPVFGSEQLTKKGLKALAAATEEILEDNPFDLATSITRSAGRGFGTSMDALFAGQVAGTGLETEITQGLLQAVPAGSTVDFDVVTPPGGGAQATLGLEAMTWMFYGVLPDEYRANAWWAASDIMMQKLSRVLANGRPLFQGTDERPLVVGDEIVGVAVGVMLGRPVVNLPFPSPGQDDTLVLFDPFETYAILDSGDIRADLSRDVEFKEDVVVWKFVRRVDGTRQRSISLVEGVGLTTV